MANNDDWSDLLATHRQTKSFHTDTGERIPAPKKRKKKRTPGVLAMAVITLLSISAVIILIIALITQNITLSAKTAEYNDISAKYDEIVNQKAEAIAQTDAIKSETDNINMQIKELEG